MAVRDWIDEYVSRHRALTGPHDWPDAASDEWTDYLRGWVVAFIGQSVTEAEADAASVKLAAAPPRFRRDHLPAVLRAVNDARSPGGGGVDSREAALAASRNCGHCCGGGLAVVYRPAPKAPDCSRCGAALDPDGVCRECHPGCPPVPASVAAYCVCPYGQWVERTHRDTSQDVWKRTPRLADVHAGRSVWRPHPPGLEPCASGEVGAVGEIGRASW